MCEIESRKSRQPHLKYQTAIIKYCSLVLCVDILDAANFQTLLVMLTWQGRDADSLVVAMVWWLWW